MLSAIKKDLRIAHDYMDNDIQDTIDACLSDMTRAGVVLEVDNPLELQAVKWWARWVYNFENQGDRYEKMYHSLVTALSLRV